MKIYLDVCCLNRPFDDQTQDKIRLESEAIISIFTHVVDKSWNLIGSDIVDFEISKIPDPTRKDKVNNLIKNMHHKVKLNPNIIKRAKNIQLLGINSMDALHIASAESSEAVIFLTTDLDILKKYQNNRNNIFIKIENPLTWIIERL